MMPPALRTASAISLGDAALVEGARAVLRDRLQGVGEIELQQPVAFVQRLAAVEENRRR